MNLGNNTVLLKTDKYKKEKADSKDRVELVILKNTRSKLTYLVNDPA